MSNKIFRSIITTAALVLLASFVIIIGVLYGYFTQVIEKQLREELDIAAAAVEEQGGEYIKRLHTGAVTVADGSIRPDGGSIRLTLISSTGEVIYDTKSDAQTMENHIDRREIRDAMNGGYEPSIFFDAYTKNYLLRENAQRRFVPAYFNGKRFRSCACTRHDTTDDFCCGDCGYSVRRAGTQNGETYCYSAE